jgi:hypothetical protein
VFSVVWSVLGGLEFAYRVGELDVASGLVAGLEGLIDLDGDDGPRVAGSLAGDHCHSGGGSRLSGQCPRGSSGLEVFEEARDGIHFTALIAQITGDCQGLLEVPGRVLGVTLRELTSPRLLRSCIMLRWSPALLDIAIASRASLALRSGSPGLEVDASEPVGGHG